MILDLLTYFFVGLFFVVFLVSGVFLLSEIGLRLLTRITTKDRIDNIILGIIILIIVVIVFFIGQQIVTGFGL